MIEWAIHTQLQGATGPMSLDTELTLPTGQLIGLYGPSGAGKTTLLRILAGLFQPERGRVRFGKETWLDTERGVFLPARKRGVGFVFQDYALFPNMTVGGNLRYALGRGQDRQVVNELLVVMELEDLAEQYPLQLSGGQQQRVALARALVRRPQLLLLDEPFSALDANLRHKLGSYLQKAHQRYHLTTILVSHDVAGLRQMTDQLIKIENGQTVEASASDPTPAGRPGVLRGQILALEEIDQQLWLTIATDRGPVSVPIGKEEGSEMEVGTEIELLLQTKRY